jgi:glycosyltransferase involved in cell wall biosynthesis
MVKITFIGSFGKGTKYLNGESVKTRDVLCCLKTAYRVQSFNISEHKIWRTLSFLFSVFFWKPDIVFVCKAPTGVKKILSMLRKARFPSDRIVVYMYGLGLTGIYQSLVKPKDISYLHTLIVETPFVADELKMQMHANIVCFPCVKKVYDIPDLHEKKEKKTLSLLFFSRVIPEKGVFDICQSVIRLNSSGVKFSLDIAGKPLDGDDATVASLQEMGKKYGFIHYLGTSFTITGPESYVRFNLYDLHVFPSKFFHECAPGSLVDSFIASVPTMSTTFKSYEAMLNSEFSYLIPQNDAAAMDAMLLSIYSHQDLLLSKRPICHAQSHKYSYSAFLDFIQPVLGSVVSHG